MSVVECALRSAPEIRIACRLLRSGLAGIAEHDVHAKVVIARLRQLLVDADSLSVLTGIVHPHQAPAIALGDSRENRTSFFFRRGRGNGAIDQLLRVVDEHARRRAR